MKKTIFLVCFFLIVFSGYGYCRALEIFCNTLKVTKNVTYDLPTNIYGLVKGKNFAKLITGKDLPIEERWTEYAINTAFWGAIYYLYDKRYRDNNFSDDVRRYNDPSTPLSELSYLENTIHNKESSRKSSKYIKDAALGIGIYGIVYGAFSSLVKGNLNWEGVEEKRMTKIFDPNAIMLSSNTYIYLNPDLITLNFKF